MNITGSKKPVKSAIRTMQLFSLFAEQKQTLSLTELATAIDIPKSSCYQLVQTLISLGYIIAIDGGNSYYPSRRLFDMAQHINQFNPIREKMQGELKRLRNTTGETIVIGRLQDRQVIYLEVYNGTHDIRYTPAPGDLKALHSSAMGKALLGSLDDVAQSQLIRELELTRFTEKTITRKKDLKDNLFKCEKQGIYTTQGEHLADVMSLAVPVQMRGHQMAIAMTGPIPRMRKNINNYETLLKDVAEKISY